MTTDTLVDRALDDLEATNVAHHDDQVCTATMVACAEVLAAAGHPATAAAHYWTACYVLHPVRSRLLRLRYLTRDLWRTHDPRGPR